VALWSVVSGVAGSGGQLLIAKMSQNSVDDVLVFDASNRPYRPTAAGTDFDLAAMTQIAVIRAANSVIDDRWRESMRLQVFNVILYQRRILGLPIPF